MTNKSVTMREIKPAYSYEHVHEPNEETYRDIIGKESLFSHTS